MELLGDLRFVVKMAPATIDGLVAGRVAVAEMHHFRFIQICQLESCFFLQRFEQKLQWLQKIKATRGVKMLITLYATGKEIAGCVTRTRKMLTMWEVIATSKSGRVRTKVFNNWKIGMQLAGRAMEMGWKVSILPVYVDFFVVGDDGELTQVVVRVSPQTAARYAVRWARMDRNQSGCIAWPHKAPLPPGWKVVKQESY